MKLLCIYEITRREEMKAIRIIAINISRSASSACIEAVVVSLWKNRIHSLEVIREIFTNEANCDALFTLVIHKSSLFNV